MSDTRKIDALAKEYAWFMEKGGTSRMEAEDAIRKLLEDNRRYRAALESIAVVDGACLHLDGPHSCDQVQETAAKALGGKT